MTQYYSNSKEEYVNINDMHHQHVWYAFKKLCDRLEELGICDHIWEDDYNVTTFKKKEESRKNKKWKKDVDNSFMYDKYNK